MEHDLVAHCGAVGDFASLALWRVLFFWLRRTIYMPTRSCRVQKIASAGEVSLANSFSLRSAGLLTDAYLFGLLVGAFVVSCRHRISPRSAGLLTDADISSFLVVCMIKARNGAEKIFY
jgi:hypothetical protein